MSAIPVRAVPSIADMLYADARLAYETWVGEVGSGVPFDRLSNAERTGWLAAVIAVVDQVEDEAPKCAECGADLFCDICDPEVCSVCGGTLTCARCGAKMTEPTSGDAESQPLPVWLL